MECFLRVLSVNRFFTIEMTVVATVILLIKSLPVTYLISLIYNVLKLLKPTINKNYFTIFITVNNGVFFWELYYTVTATQRGLRLLRSV